MVSSRYEEVRSLHILMGSSCVCLELGQYDAGGVR
jgi:hypothetical protein